MGELSKIPWKEVEQKKGGGEIKILKRGGKLGQGMGALKGEGGVEPPYLVKKLQTQQAFICWKSAMETPGQCV